MLLLLLIILLFIITLFLFQNEKKSKLLKKSKLQKLKAIDFKQTKKNSPIKNVMDDKGNILNVGLIVYPFTDKNKTEIFKSAKKNGMLFIGCSSYINFPNITENKYDITNDPNHYCWGFDYFEFVFAWIHCFRNPELYFPSNLPKELISESDFTNKTFDYQKRTTKEFDFIYICLKDNESCHDGWQSENRNWVLAKKCIEIMCSKYKMKGLIVGRIGCKIHKNCTVTDFLQYHEFIKQYDRCKFVFVPNILDASPRVLSESLIRDLPCLVNKNILGGWKYVNSNTGEYFNNMDDFEISLKKLIANMKNYQPRKYFLKNHGNDFEGKKLLELIKNNVPASKINVDLSNCKYLRPAI